MLLLVEMQGTIDEQRPDANATLLPFSFWMFSWLSISCVALTFLLLSGAETGLKLKYEADGP